MEKIKNYLEDKKEELKQNLNEISENFIADYSIDSSIYICDAFSECADNYVDIYNCDLLEWAKNNYSLVEDAIDELGIATDSNGRADFIKTIMDDILDHLNKQLFEIEEE